MMKSVLAVNLKNVVHESVALLGEVLKKELGPKEYQRIEALRVDMAKLRTSSQNQSEKILQKHLSKLQNLTPRQRLHVGRAFTLMLELMNACENAYRSQQLKKRHHAKLLQIPESITYVLTAHPTEARSKQNIWVFHEILQLLTDVLGRIDYNLSPTDSKKLQHLLQIAWKISIVRGRKPRVQDEAEHIYSTLLRDETLKTLLAFSTEVSPIRLQSWVGGDKDGHPGVDEKVFHDSLTLSRSGLLDFLLRRLLEVEEILHKTNYQNLYTELNPFLLQLRKSIRGLRQIKTGDGVRVEKLKKDFTFLFKLYEKNVHVLHPSLQQIQKVWDLFPALVVPLEFRESSDVLLSRPQGQGLAIYRMLTALESFSRGTDPRFYVRGFIISMASETQHLKIAANMVKQIFGQIKLPIIPLFEQLSALKKSVQITKEVLADRELSLAMKKHWNARFEIMLGYSDSSKESGVLQSRLGVAEAMHAVEKFCQKKNITPLFFQGSGGSTDRGGGTVEEQTAWWSKNALRNYKVTIQGEMVERSLANPEITRGQLDKIALVAGTWKSKKHHLTSVKALDALAIRVADKYKEKVTSEDFLQLIEKATPYPFLDLLKIGSRPAKRKAKISVAGLRAIPWILCWTQTRVLFPTWWGVGSAFAEMSKQEQIQLVAAYKKHPLFASYIRALGFTLAKVELDVWNLYLQESGLTKDTIGNFKKIFLKEFKLTKKFVLYILQSQHLILDRQWLQESITLRSPMIHPLNLLQIIAMKKNEVSLLRVCVTGISSGMMTTG